jgi:subtilase family serine protease
MFHSRRLWLIAGLGVWLSFGVIRSGQAAEALRVLPGNVPPAVARLQALSRVPATNYLELAIGLPLRNEAELDELLRQLYDPASTNFHKYLQPAEFAARFGPTPEDYQAVQDFARSNGLVVAETFTNRLMLDVRGRVTDVERALGVTLRTYRHPVEPRDFFAPDTDPSLPARLRVISIEGLSDYSLPRRATRRVAAARAQPLSFNGTGPSHEYAGNDFRNAYVPGTGLDGSGQTVAVLEYSDYFMVDVTNYENYVGALIGVTNYVPLTTVLVGSTTPGTNANDEVALDIEMAIAMAPKLARIIVYEKYSVSSTLLNRIATDNLAKQVSSSWLVGNWSSGTATAYDNILKNMATQGQSFFQASGDHDAWTGPQPLDSGVTVPLDSPYATIVGGTTLTMNNYGVSWASETVWNRNLSGIPNEGSGGGISTYYTIPAWQTNINMTTNGGSAIYRNIPDVALTANNIFVCFGNGDTSGFYYFSGTSAAAPLWAGFIALVNQQSVAANPTNFVGFLNPALYAIAASTNYNNCFHDIATGDNIGTNTPGMFYATNGYDLCTGLGTPAGTNLINALAPMPYCLTQPANLTVTAGSSAQFSVLAAGLPPLGYRWLFNGTNLPATANVFGTASNVVTLTNVTSANAGNYRVIVTNASGSATSTVAALTVNGQSSPVMTLTSSANPCGYLNSLSFTAGLTPAGATGTVQFLTNGILFNTQTLTAGSAISAALATLPRGTSTIAARYSGDTSFLPVTNTFLQAVTNHPPLALVFYTNRYAGLSLKLPVSVLTNNWSDADGDALALAGIGVSTNGVTVIINAGTLVYFNTNNVADRFACSISDGWGGTNLQYVYIAVLPLPSNAVPAIAGVVSSNGMIWLSLGGMGGLTYVVQGTTNLMSPGSWLPLATNVPETNGFWRFSDAITNNPYRFYRLKLAP